MGHLQIADESANFLHSQTHIWNHLFSFINSMTLKFAIELGILDIINDHGGPITLSELIEALPINKEKSHSVERVILFLVHSGFLIKQNRPNFECDKEEEEECYSITPASRLLLEDEPLSLKPFVLAMLDPMLIDPWKNMSKWSQNDDLNPYSTTHGRSYYDYDESQQKVYMLFNQAMTSDTRLVANVLVKDFGGVFEGLTSLVDVGGCTGTLSKALANAFTHLHCINFDLPHVVDGLEESKNLRHVGGNMFKEIPVADAVLLKWVLHNWTDEKCIDILKNCKKAIPSKEKGGKVIIIEMVVDENRDKRSYGTQLLFDLLMMVDAHGKQRNEKDWDKLFFASGFSDYRIMPVLGVRSIIEIYP